VLAGRASFERVELRWMPLGTIAGVVAAVLAVLTLYVGVREHGQTEALLIEYANVAPAAGPGVVSRLKSIEEIGRLAGQD
jgi:hypothetical protein